jgi:hypothetical protein
MTHTQYFYVLGLASLVIVVPSCRSTELEQRAVAYASREHSCPEEQIGVVSKRSDEVMTLGVCGTNRDFIVMDVPGCADEDVRIAAPRDPEGNVDQIFAKCLPSAPGRKGSVIETTCAKAGARCSADVACCGDAQCHNGACTL